MSGQTVDSFGGSLKRSYTIQRLAKTRMKRRWGKPKTEKERQASHFKRYGTKKLPPRGTGRE